jgi:hypothetical protein
MSLYNEIIKYLDLCNNSKYHFGISLSDEELSDEFLDKISEIGETNNSDIWMFSCEIGNLLCFKNEEDLLFYKLFSNEIDSADDKDVAEFIIESNINNGWENIFAEYPGMGPGMKHRVLYMLWYKDAGDLFDLLKDNNLVTGKMKDGKKYL